MCLLGASLGFVTEVTLDRDLMDKAQLSQSEEQRGGHGAERTTGATALNGGEGCVTASPPWAGWQTGFPPLS